MALVSPGISISISDQSQYVNSNVGSVPLVVLATAQNKTYNGSPAAGTSKANAGKLMSFTSQRELVTAMGTPTFQLSSIGTPVNGSEVNEYGLLTAYSALGLSNQLYAIRADIDLNQLTGTSVRPSSAPMDGDYWLDTANTDWGIYSLNATTSSFKNITSLDVTGTSLLVIQNPNYVFTNTNFTPSISFPRGSFGQPGDYALVLVNPDGTQADTIRLYYKADTNSVGLNNTWQQVGSTYWQNSVPVVIGTALNPYITASSTFTINTVTVTTTGTTTVAALRDSINNANITGVNAALSNTNQLELFVTSNATSNGSQADGKLILTDGTNTPMATCGITATTYYCPYLFYGNYAQAPSGGWFSTDSAPRPTGSIWWKTGATGGGFNPVFKQYSSSTSQWSNLSVPLYQSFSTAIYSLDPTGGGANIPHGTVIAQYGVASASNSSNSLRFFEQHADLTYNAGPSNNTTEGHGLPIPPTTITTATSGTFAGGNSGDSFTLSTTAPGTNTLVSYTIALNGTTASTFVQDILAKNIPYIVANLNTNGTIDIYHQTGGQFQMTDVVSGTLARAGFVAGQGSGFSVIGSTIYVSNWQALTSTISYQPTAPTGTPADGTLWYYSNAAEVDVMINDGTGWKGYQNVAKDVRNFNLQNTDANGVIVSATQPVSQSSGDSLVAGDLWLDSSDLVNYPALSRFNGSIWVAIDNTDHVSNNGIIFADARWDSTGTTDVIGGDFPLITTLLTSDYLDQDAPDYRLYPRGTLLFNTRRSGYNVKRYVTNYFTSTNFPNAPTVPGSSSSLPSETGTWKTASGLDNNGVMKAGQAAQRAVVVSALQSAVDSNLDVLSDIYKFNLIVTPGYPELIPNMLTLNNNRGDTAFVIGDTPMSLTPTTVAITNWVNNVNGTGLPSDAAASPYLALYYPAGQTNDLAGNTVAVPASHAVLRTFLYNDQISYPWFAPAGVNRGLISNMSNIGYINSTTGQFVQNAISQGLRDALFTLGVNPLTQLPGTGLVVFGQLTRSGSTSARNRVNVVRLENYLRTIFKSISNGYLFEPNDSVTRKSIASQIESALNNVLAHRGIYDYLVICDTSNNTSSTIANNQLYVDVAIEPMKDVEFIYIPIAIYNPGAISQLNTTST